jgi:hypothetical protein
MSAKETTENFWQVWNTFEWPDHKPVEYRLYYRDDGTPDIYTMEDLPGNYITVSQQVYISSPMNVRVVDGQMTVIPITQRYLKLVPVQPSGTRCHLKDVAVVTNDESGVIWGVKDHEIS